MIIKYHFNINRNVMLNKCNFFFLRSNEIKFTVEQILLYKHIERDNIGENTVQAPLWLIIELLTKLLGNY